MDDLLKEWLENFPFAWDYWKFNEDWDALRKWYGPGRDGADRFLDSKTWYDQATEYDASHFHADDFAADFNIWKQPFWTAEQATALTLGKDPNVINLDYINKCVEPSIFVWYFKHIRDRILQAQTDQELPSPIRARTYVEWAVTEGISFPSELEQIVPEHDNSADDYLWLYKSAVRENERLAAKVDDLERELERKQEPSAVAPSPSPELSHRRDAVMKAIKELWGGVATGVTEKQRNRAINSWLHKHGLSGVSDCTIRRSVHDMRRHRR